LLLYSGIYSITKSEVLKTPLSTKFMIAVKVAVTLLREAISKTVSVVKGGELYGICAF